MTHAELKELVQKYFAEYLSRFKQRIDTLGPLSDQETRLYQNTLEITDTAITETDYSWFPELETRLKRIVEGHQSIESFNEKEIGHLKSLYLQGHKSYFERALNYSLHANDLIIDTDHKPAVVCTERAQVDKTLEQLVQEYIEEQSRSGRGWKRATQEERKAQLSVLVETLGANFDMTNLTPAIAIKVKAAVLSRPRNFNKKKVLNSPVAVMEGDDKLSNKTVNNYLSCYGSFNKSHRSPAILSSDIIVYIRQFNTLREA